MVVLRAASLVEGDARGELMLWSVPLSFWGGLDASNGRIIDRSHPACGMIVTGRILAMPAGRGSSSASSVLAEAIRLGTAPLGIILAQADPIITIGAMVAQKLYGLRCPVVVCDASAFERLIDGMLLRVIARESGATIEAIGQATLGTVVMEQLGRPSNFSGRNDHGDEDDAP